MARKLSDYQSKRDFTVTQEPAGTLSPRRGAKRLRFCVQRHSARAEHFDLRLEYGGVALSWAVPKGPSFSPKDKRLAMRVEDHPVDYMDFEGIIPKGEYGGGTVMLWDEGEWLPRFSPAKGLKEGSLKFFLDGKRLKGNWTLVRMKPKDGEKNDAWLLIKEHDEYEKDSPSVSRFTRSVKTNKTLKEIAKQGQTNPFHTANVMLAKPCETLPTGEGWLYELKYDGHRTLGFIENGNAVLKTRNGHDCTHSFPAVKDALETLLKERAAVVDGEMVYAGKNGVPDFSALQAHLKQKKGNDGICYVLFDLLSLDGEDLRDRPLLDRKERLSSLLRGIERGAPLSYSSHTTHMTAREQAAIMQTGMEGIVAKRANSKYAPSRNGDWQKLKFRRRQEFVIGGYTVNETGGLSSLLLGCYEGGVLKFAGKVGTGFSQTEKQELQKTLDKTKRKTSPFENAVKEKNARFATPKLLAEVEFAERTSSGLLRQASFLGLRRDKPPREVVWETETSEKESKKRASKSDENAIKTPKTDVFCGVKLTHGEKLMFPKDKITKRDLARYYEAAAQRMLPYMKERILSLVCCPSGIEGERFFRKHLEGSFRGVGFTAAGDDAEFFITGKAGLMSLVQYNAVEFHLRASGKDAKRPDVMVFDLDPDETLPLSAVRTGARELRKILTGLGLEAFLKTSGGKGYHLVVPLESGGGQTKFRDFAKKVALLAERSFPNLFTSNISKKERHGKIFLDYMRNGPKATSVAPYSVRARAHAPISMPISWDELDQIAPQDVTVKNAADFLSAPDPWKQFFMIKRKQKLK